MVGFQTASGKNVQVSDKALLKAKKLFENIETDPKPITEASNCSIKNAPAASFSVRQSKSATLPSDDSNGATSTSFDEPESVSHSNTESGDANPQSLINTPRHGRYSSYPTTSTPSIGFPPPAKTVQSGQGVKKLFHEIADDSDEDDDDQVVIPPAEKKLKLEEEEEEDQEMQSQKDESQNESIQQEVLDSTFALLADEEEDEGNRNSIFGDSNPIPLLHISQSGGKIPLVHAIILRIYPITFMSKNDQGRNVFESEKSFKKHEQRRQEIRCSKMETLYAEAKAEVEASELTNQSKVMPFNRTLNKEALEEMPLEDLLNLVRSLGEDSFVWDLLSEHKINQLQDAKLKELEQINLKIQSIFNSKLDLLQKTDPTPLLKIRIMDAKDNFQSSTPRNVLLSIWKPHDDLSHNLRECAAFGISSLNPTVNSLDLRLNSSAATRFEPLAMSQQTKAHLQRLHRKYSPLSVVLADDFSPSFGEFDTVGIIVQMTNTVPNAGLTLYIADAEINIIGVRLWTSASEQGLDAEVQLMNFVAIQNLQWRLASPRCTIPCAFVQETTLFSINTIPQPLDVAVNSLRTTVKDVKRFMESCQLKIANMLNPQRPKREEPTFNGNRCLVTSPQLRRVR